MRFARRLINALRPGRAERELDREIAAHLALLEEEYVRQGLPPAEARRAARLALGGVEQTKEQHRDARSFPWLDDVRRDLQYALRSLRRAPGFALVAIATLALGIGANTAVFSVTDALMLRWLPVRNPAELVALTRTQGGQSGENFSYPLVRGLAGHTELFGGLCGYGEGTLNVGPSDALEEVQGLWVSGGYYQTLGLTPAAGRLLAASDDEPAAAPSAVISDAFWTRRFQRDPGVLGRTLLIEAVPVPIVGVSPPGFNGAIVGSDANITLAIAIRPQLQPERVSFVGAGSRWLRILARPATGIAREQLQARLSVVWPELVGASLPPTASVQSRQLALSSTLGIRDGGSGSSALRTQFRWPLLVLMGVVGLVLLIACANVANLLLARATVRQREFSVRMAMGAGQSRLVRQLLTESALLALAGATLGLFVASTGSHFLIDLVSTATTDPDQSAVSLAAGLNWRVMAFAGSVALGTTFLFGLMPAMRATRISVAAAMSANSTRATGSRGRLGSALVTFQVALSLVLLTGAGLFLGTLQNLRTLDAGFNPRGVLLVNIDARRAGYQGARLGAFNQQALEFASRLPGVRAASMSAVTPLMGGGMSMPIAVNGQPVRGDIGATEFHFNLVGPGYFQVLQTPVVLGREFAARDDERAPSVAIVNESFARLHMNGNPLGQRVSVVGAAAQREVVGVVRDAVYESLRQEAPPTVYVPIAQSTPAPIKLVISADGSLEQITSAIRKEIQPKLAGYPVSTRTLAQQLESSVGQERLMATLGGIFGALALMLAVIGLYGLLTYSVSNRTREMGIRLALGARRGQVIGFVLRDAARLLAIGAVIGILGGWMTLRVIQSMLFGLTTTDIPTMTAAAGLLVGAGLLAGFLPAYRASHVDPLIALRAE